MAVTVVGTGSAAATSVAIPAHQAGDVILIAARGTAAAPSVPAAGGTVPTWTTLQSGLANAVGLTVVAAKATAANHTTGVFTNATHVAVLVLRASAGNQLDFAAARSSVGNGNNTQTIVYPALTFADLDGSSFGVRVGTRGVAVTAVGTAPSGWTAQVVQPTGAGALMSVHTRSAVVANPTADSVSTAGTNSAYRAVTIEVQEMPLAQVVSVGGVGTGGAFGSARIPQKVQLPSGVYPAGFIPSITGAVISGDGHLVGGSPAGQFGPVTAAFVTSQTKPVAGVGSAQSFGAITVRTVVARAVAGLGSAQSFGTVTAKSISRVVVTGVPSAQAFGAISAGGTNFASVAGVQSAQAFGALTLKSGATTKTVAGVLSAQAFGTFTLRLGVTPLGVPSAQAFGTISSRYLQRLAGIPSAQAFGSLAVLAVVTKPVTGVASPAAFGVVKALRTVTVPGLSSAQAFGALGFKLSFRPAGLPSAQAFGIPRVGLVWWVVTECTSLELDAASEQDLVLAASPEADLDLDPVVCQ